MADLVMDAINEAFCAEIKHTYCIISREIPARGGYGKSAKLLLERIKTLQAYHSVVIDLLNSGDDEDDGPD